MKKHVLMLALASSSLLVAGESRAQQQASQNTLDVDPDMMPVDVPYGAPISLDRAQGVISAALAEAKKHDWKINSAVVDSGGNLVAFARMDGAQLASTAISEHKARTEQWRQCGSA
jgi:glc operon protein GlcG